MPALEPVRVTFLLFPAVTQLDLTGPAQVLSRLGNATVDVVAKSLEPVSTDSGFSILPTAVLEDITATDILCVPGGLGTESVIEDEDYLSWVRQIGTTAKWVTSVCTGSIILGAAGLLRGYRATSHWASIQDLSLFGAEPVNQRVVFDRNRVTGGGVTAGVDFALELTEAVRGPDYAKLIQLSLEYDPSPPFDSGNPRTASESTVDRYVALSKDVGRERLKRRQQAAQRLGFQKSPVD